MLTATNVQSPPRDRATLRRVASILALALVTIGAGIPLVMMLHGSIVNGTDYVRWTWPAIPAAWLPAALGAALLTRREATGAMLLVLGAALGVAFFWEEWAAFTFAPAWLIGAWAYLDTGRRRGWV